MTMTKNEHDLFCWECGLKDTTLKCSKCVRSFHIDCQRNNRSSTVDGTDWMCLLCSTLNDPNNTDKLEDVKALSILMKKLFKGNQYNILKNPFKWIDRTKPIVNAFGLNQIKEIIGTYTSFAEFKSDILWILHNCQISFQNDHKKTMAARSLLKWIDDEIEDIKNCAKCYTNAYKYPKCWFTMVCDEPHVIVWARVVGFCWWPAKVMGVDGLKVSVDFFGDHTQAKVLVDNCFLFSKSSPKPPRILSDEYTAAMNEVNEYIQNVRKNFSFEFAENKTPFVPSLMNCYLAQSLNASAIELEEITNEENKIMPKQNTYRQVLDESEQDESDLLVNSQQRCKKLRVSLNRVYLYDEKGFQNKGKRSTIEINDVITPKKTRLNKEINDDSTGRKGRFNDEFGKSNSSNPRKVRFSDEFGGQLSQVFLIEVNDESDHSNDDVELTADATEGIIEIGHESINPGDDSFLSDSNESRTDDDVFEEIEQNIKIIQTNVLNLMHINKLKTEALANDLKKMATSKEICAIELSQLYKKYSQLQTVISEQNHVIMQTEKNIQRINDEHTKEISELNDAWKREKLRNNDEIKMLQKKVTQMEMVIQNIMIGQNLQQGYQEDDQRLE